MNTDALPRPRPHEYNPYYQKYIDLVPDGDILEILRNEMEATQELLASVPPDKEEDRYADGKWSLREVVGHLIDTERLFSFRALWFARGAEGDMPGMDQEIWAQASTAGRRPLAELAREWAALRASNVLFFGSLTADDGKRQGVASNFEVTVRALPWMMAGHELHHRTIIRREYLGEDV